MNNIKTQVLVREMNDQSKEIFLYLVFKLFFTKLRRTLFASRTFSVSPIFIFCLHRKDSVLFFLFVWTECNSDRLTYISKKKKKWGGVVCQATHSFQVGFSEVTFFPSIFCLFQVFLLVFFLYNTCISLKISEQKYIAFAHSLHFPQFF